MKVELIEPHDLAEGHRDHLWDQGVNLDDWDYMLVAPPEAVEVYDEHGRPGLRPVNSVHERLLSGCCENRWYLVEFRGERVAMGIAYHG